MWKSNLLCRFLLWIYFGNRIINPLCGSGNALRLQSHTADLKQGTSPMNIDLLEAEDVRCHICWDSISVTDATSETGVFTPSKQTAAMIHDAPCSDPKHSVHIWCLLEEIAHFRDKHDNSSEVNKELQCGMCRKPIARLASAGGTNTNVRVGPGPNHNYYRGLSNIESDGQNNMDESEQIDNIIPALEALKAILLERFHSYIINSKSWREHNRSTKRKDDLALQAGARSAFESSTSHDLLTTSMDINFEYSKFAHARLIEKDRRRAANRYFQCSQTLDVSEETDTVVSKEHFIKFSFRLIAALICMVPGALLIYFLYLIYRAIISLNFC